MLAHTDIDLENRSKTDSYDSQTGTYGNDAKLHSNKRVDLEDRASLDGDASAPTVAKSSGFALNGVTTVSGQKVSFMPVELPDFLDDLGAVHLSGHDMMVLTPGSYEASSLVIEDDAVLNIDNDNGPVTLYVTGPVTLRQRASITSGDLNTEKFALYIVGGDDVYVKGDAVFEGVLYAPDSQVEVNDHAQFFGSIVSHEIDIEDHAQFHYDRHLKTD